MITESWRFVCAVTWYTTHPGNDYETANEPFIVNPKTHPSSSQGLFTTKAWVNCGSSTATPRTSVQALSRKRQFTRVAARLAIATTAWHIAALNGGIIVAPSRNCNDRATSPPTRGKFTQTSLLPDDQHAEYRRNHSRVQIGRRGIASHPHPKASPRGNRVPKELARRHRIGGAGLHCAIRDANFVSHLTMFVMQFNQ